MSYDFGLVFSWRVYTAVSKLSLNLFNRLPLCFWTQHPVLHCLVRSRTLSVHHFLIHFYQIRIHILALPFLVSPKDLPCIAPEQGSPTPLSLLWQMHEKYLWGRTSESKLHWSLYRNHCLVPRICLGGFLERELLGINKNSYSPVTEFSLARAITGLALEEPGFNPYVMHARENSGTTRKLIII